MEFHNFV